MRLLIIFLIICTLFTEIANAQKSKQTDTRILNNDYQVNLKNYQTNKTIAWSVAGTGMVLLGIVLPSRHRSFIYTMILPKAKVVHYELQAVYSALQVFLFHKASKYKRKASVALKNESATI